MLKEKGPLVWCKQRYSKSNRYTLKNTYNTHSDNKNSTNNNNRFERISVPFLSLFSIAILQMLVKHFIFFVHLNSYLSTSFTYYYIVVVHGILLNVPKCCNIKIILLLKLLLYNHHYIIHMKKHTPCIQYTWYY